MTRGATLLVIVGTGLAACTERGIVGITASRSVDRDAAAADASTLPDVGRPGPGVTAIDECVPTNGANLDPDTARRLVDTTGDASAMRFLYPYDGTVYPQSIPGPVIMWDGPPSQAVYVGLHSSTFDYRGCLTPTAPNRLALPSGIWDLAAQSTHGEDDPFTLDLKVLSGDSVYGPISEQLVVALGGLPGSIYYMTTASLAVGGIMRVRAGRPAEPFLTPPSCAGCHSVSANGTRFLAFSSGVDNSFTLSGAAPPMLLGTAAPGADLSGVYPDGSLYVASARPSGGGGPRNYTGGAMQAALYDAASGTIIDDSGVPTGAVMPSFSPDGSQLAFTDFGPSPGHTLALMSFDIQRRLASGYQSLYSSVESQFVGWPSFLPDGRALVFAQGDAADFSGGNVGLVPIIRGSQTDLFIVDAQSHVSTLLLQAMGFASPDDLEAGKTYLPGGVSDLHQSYYPAVAPAASGGYAWVLFDSARSYGNQGAPRAIWGTAISLSAGGYVGDPSHPAFYLPGQNAATPNFRAVAAPDP